jgi:type VI secretion system secreted protein VgrG
MTGKPGRLPFVTRPGIMALRTAAEAAVSTRERQLTEPMATHTYTQAGRHLSVTTPLGKDVLLLIGFEGEEEMSRLYSYTLEFLSDRADIGGKDLIGKPISWGVHPTGGIARVYHGIVRNFSASGLELRKRRYYRAEVVPWLWFLTQTNDCRIFQNKKPPDIIKQIFDEFGFRDYQSKLQGSYPTLEYCVQYRESDFDSSHG